MRAVLSIGSNQGESLALLGTVAQEFAGQIVAASPIYRTPPWGVTDQESFLNAVLIVDTPDTPIELLRRGQALEEQAQRVRERHWGPRTLDVDIVDIAGYASQDPELTVPHPYAHERAFVLVPWLAADPEATLRGEGVGKLIDALPPADVAAIVDTGHRLV